MGAEAEENDSTWVPLTPEITKKPKNVHKESGSKKAMEKDPNWLPKTPKVTGTKNDRTDNLKPRSLDDEDVSNKKPRKKTHRPKVFDSRPVKVATPKPRTPPKTEGKSRKGRTPKKTKTAPRTPKTDKSSKSSNAKSKTPKVAGRRSCKRKLDYGSDTNDDEINQSVSSTSLPIGTNEESDRMELSTYVKFKRRRMVRSRMSLGKLSRLVEIIHDKCLCPCKFTLNLSWMHPKRKRSDRKRRRLNEFIAANNESEDVVGAHEHTRDAANVVGLGLEDAVGAHEHTRDDANVVGLGFEDAVGAHEHTRDDVNVDGLGFEDDGVGNMRVDKLQVTEPKLPTDSNVKLDDLQFLPEQKLPTDSSFHRSVFSIKDKADGEIYADFLSRKMASLCITDEYEKKADKLKQLILFNQNKKKIGKRKLKLLEAGSKQLIAMIQKKKNAKYYKVDLDDTTLKVWAIEVENKEGESSSKEEGDDREYWEKERDECVRKLATVMDCIHPFLGDRPFSRWKGSVVDSIVGVFLTQNVSDSLSSSAFMSLVERYPVQKSRRDEFSGQIELSLIDEFQQDESNSQDLESQPDEYVNMGDQTLMSQASSTSEFIFAASYPPLIQEPQQECSSSQVDESQQDESNNQIDLNQDPEYEYINIGDNTSTELSQVSSTSEFICTPSEGTLWRKKKGSKYDNEGRNWDDLRKKYGKSENRENHCADSVDWEAVRRASTDEFAAVIEARGMSNQLAGKIKAFLDRVVKDHGSIDLEWLRHVPTNDAKDYLLSIYGLGLKSSDCVMLLSLHERAFPVDVNIGRVLVRLGIVPLKPLPEGVLFHDLNSYPLLDDVEKYLWPRICNLDVPKLYALHCYLNAFSKAFCTKLSPNCKACPLKGDCKHYASVLASSRMAIEDSHSREKNMATESSTKSKCWIGVACEDRCASQSIEPIIEFPASPKHVLPELLEADIEDIGYDMPLNDKVISTIVKNSRSILGDSMSKALVALKPRTTPTPKLKHLERLRTVHQVFELPDSHPLLAGFENRQNEDPNPYLLAIWLTEQNEDPKKTCSCPQSSSCGIGSCCSRGIIQYQHVETVEGTILIPSRTAVRGSFPLNGTYFQFNEVFADHESSITPLDVPTKCLGSLTKRILYCGTTITSICKDMSLEEIAFNFSRCFICIRGFDVQTGGPRHLSKRFHRNTIKPISKEP